MEISKYQELLSNELFAVRNELEKIATYDASTGDWETKADSRHTSDPNEHSDTVEDAAERRAEMSDLETRYRNIVKALDKIESGEFGTCELCSDIIEEDRLLANPAARTCITDRDREKELTI